MVGGHRRRGLAAELPAQPKLLILGSMPGERSLAAGEYYAHPRNQFWALAQRLWGVPADAPYPARLEALKAQGVGLWDLLASCERRGSLDSAIDLEGAVLNDLVGLLRGYAPQPPRVACNGGLAHRLFKRHVLPALSPPPTLVLLPSSSPAHAGRGLNEKLELWRAALGVPGLARETSGWR